MIITRRAALKILAGVIPSLKGEHAFAFGQSVARIASGPFEGTRESLKTYRIPDWFRDAKFGIWAHLQRPGKDGPAFLRTDLFPKLVSETHAMHHVDIDGDGLKDLVTGKRFWSHGRSEPGSNDPARLYWLKARKAPDGMMSFTPYVIDDNSGIGTQVIAGFISNKKYPDVVVGNKKGVFVFEHQVKKSKSKS